MKAQHTSGPWVTETSDMVVEITDSATEGKCIALVHIPSPRNDDWGVRSEYLGNVHLIAAAPDMLAALENLLGSVEAFSAAGPLLERDTEEMRQARAAIAKAKGVQS